METPDDGAPANPPGADRALDDILARIADLRTETRARLAVLGAAVSDPAAPAAPPRPLLTRPTGSPPAPAPARTPPRTPAPDPTPDPPVRTPAPAPASAPAAAPVTVAPAAAGRDRLAVALRGLRRAVTTTVHRSRTSFRGTVATLARLAAALAGRVRTAGSALRALGALGVAGGRASVDHLVRTGRRVRSRAADGLAALRVLAARGATGVATRFADGRRRSGRLVATIVVRGRRLATAALTRTRHLGAATAAALAAVRRVRPQRRAVVAATVIAAAALGGILLAADDTTGPGAAAPSDVATAPATPIVVPAPDTPAAPIVPPAAPDPSTAAPPPEPTPAPDPAPVPEPTPEPARPSRRPPKLLRIPAIGVEAPTVPVGLEQDGAMEIPVDVRTIGWYEPGEGVGVAPGQVGTAVLAGHVDSRTQGAGAFYYLRDLVVGDEVVIDHDDGTSSTWRITEVIQYPKDELPIDEVFVWDGPPRLALITCGGAFDWTVRSYTDNLVVHAEPVTVAAEAPTATPS